MVNGKLPPRFAPRDFGFENGDPRVEFVDRKRIEILLCQQRQRIVGATGEKLVDIHGPMLTFAGRACQ